ncbi:MAG: hypothetical protein AAGK66_04060 [Pseudomonadota bacterium]
MVLIKTKNTTTEEQGSEYCGFEASVALTNAHSINTENKFLQVYLVYITVTVGIIIFHIETRGDGEYFPWQLLSILIISSFLFLVQLHKYGAWKKHYQSKIRSLFEKKFGQELQGDLTLLPGWFEARYKRPGFFGRFSSDSFLLIVPWAVASISLIRLIFILFPDQFVGVQIINAD